METPPHNSLPPGSEEAHSAEELLLLLYDDLRRLAAARLAREKPGQTLQATALVHEAWLRLENSPHRPWANQAHFFAAAAQAMRRILVEQARRKLSLKRGDRCPKVDLASVEIAAPVPDEQLLALDEALEALGREDPQAAQLVHLRFFIGLTHEEAAELLGLSRSTADRTWVFAKAWLAHEIKSAGS